MGNDTITITLPSGDSYNNSYNYDTYPSYYSASSAYTTNTITLPSFSSINGQAASSITFDDFWYFPKKTPFIDGFPEWGDFEKMRNEYPALNTAFENLKMVHKLCEAEWEGKKKEND